jgi:signal transduction histidine kinase
MKTLESRKVESMEWYEEAFDRYFSVKSSPIFDGNGEIVKFVDLIRDITELKRTEQQLKEVDKAKNLFFSIISHDLRNPLITLASGNELLVNRVDRYDKDHIRSIAEEMLDSSKNLLDLLNALFEWSKLQRGKMEYKPKKMDMFYIVEQVLQLFQSSADEKAVILNNDLEEDTFIYGDYNMVYTIVRNLINNAIKFTESGGEVIISAVEKGEFVEVSVSDTGVGMSPEKLCRLFRLGEPDISTKGTAGEKGTGLGLILCKEFVDKHGGKIWAESEEGNGSTVTIALPKKRD